MLRYSADEWGIRVRGWGTEKDSPSQRPVIMTGRRDIIIIIIIRRNI